MGVGVCARTCAGVWIGGVNSLYAAQNHYYDVGSYINSINKEKEEKINQLFAGCQGDHNVF